MKNFSKILIIFFLFFKITYSDFNNDFSYDLSKRMIIGDYYVFKDVEVDRKQITFSDSIILSSLPSLEDFYYHFSDYMVFGENNAHIAENHFGSDKKKMKYAIGVMGIWSNRLNLYYLSELYCDESGNLKIDSGKYKNFARPSKNGEELFHKYFKTCSDLENFFDGNKKYKLSIENALDMRYIYFFMMFAFMLGFVFAVFVVYFILLKITKFTLRFFKLEKYFY